MVLLEQGPQVASGLLLLYLVVAFLLSILLITEDNVNYYLSISDEMSQFYNCSASDLRLLFWKLCALEVTARN